MFYPNKLRHIHLEPTRDCNARCPQCSRTDGCTLNTKTDLIIDEITAEEFRDLLNTPAFSGIEQILISGNYGDIVMHTHPREFIEVLIEKKINVHVNTNGGGLSKEFWSWLGTTDVIVEFAIDGLEDTHHLYRRNTRYDVVMNNAKTFIDAGGTAHCAMNLFKHNEHQKEDVKNICEKMGFKHIKFRPDERFFSIEPIACYDNEGNITHYLEPTTEYVERFKKKDLPQFMTAVPAAEEFQELSKTIECRALSPKSLNSSIYISGEMKAWPCCWMEYVNPLQNNDFRKNDFNSIDKEFYEKISIKWNTPSCLDKCVSKCSTTVIDARLQHNQSEKIS